MASPPPGEQIPSLQAGQKRKRDEGETDAKNECRNETQDEKTAETIDEDIEDDGNAKVDIRTLVPDNYEPENENEEEQDGSDEENESAIEDNTNYPKHDESDEPFPPCVYYDEAIDDIEERFTLIAQRIYELLEGRNSSSKSLAAHKNKADELGEMPSTELIRIAILGGAGAGKSSLLNAVTAKPDLAKSLSSGQSCTCVPTEYHDCFTRQKLDFAASVQYMTPDQIKKMLKETLGDYNTFAFEEDEERDEDTRTTAKKAHENAFGVLRTLFNNLPGFKWKPAAKALLRTSYVEGCGPLLDVLVRDCETKLKYTASRNYTEYHEARNVEKLRKSIDPLMTSTATYSQPALRPLARQVRQDLSSL